MSLEENNRNKGMQRFQASMHLGMGIVYLIFGVLVIYVRYFGAIELSAGVAYTLGGFMILYGLFRIWRGVAFFKQRQRPD
ncbi:MAG TPA: hypothetical protein PL009_01015 [Flavipsychrobacter sp.]|nr:hypothetical protein [Flavipsychrobacter sp.]